MAQFGFELLIITCGFQASPQKDSVWTSYLSKSWLTDKFAVEMLGIERGERMFCPLQMDEASSALFWGTMLAKSHSCMVAGSL